MLPDVLAQAQRLREAGRFAEAAIAYEQALRESPNLPNAWYNLALCLRRIGRFDDALAAYQEALNRNVSEPEEIHLNRGVIYADHLHRPDDAEREYKRALALNPNYIPALINHANLEEDRGARAAALALYERLLALDPQNAEALARYAAMKGPADATLPDRLRQRLTDPRLAAAERASLNFSLGKVLDERSAYDDAFAAYVEANTQSRASAAGKASYDRTAQERLTDALIETFSTPTSKPQSPERAPIFICGMFRSGSTLTEQILASHPRVTSGGELYLIPDLARALAPYPQSLKTLTPERIVSIAADYRAKLAALFPHADILTDKRPDNILHVGLIKTLMPNARIVHTIRNPLDNCLSVFFLHLDHSMAYALDLQDAAHYCREERRIAAHWRALYPGDVLDFDYDAFVANPRAEAEKLLAFCGLDWNENVLAFHQAKNIVKTASAWQVREPLYARSSGRWKNYERHLAPLRAALADLL